MESKNLKNRLLLMDDTISLMPAVRVHLGCVHVCHVAGESDMEKMCDVADTRLLQLVLDGFLVEQVQWQVFDMLELLALQRAPAIMLCLSKHMSAYKMTLQHNKCCLLRCLALPLPTR